MSLVDRPRNEVIVAGHGIQLNCTSNNTAEIISWYNSTCILKMYGCPASNVQITKIYGGFGPTTSAGPRINVSWQDNKETKYRNIVISQAELTDGNVYLCQEGNSEIAYADLVILPQGIVNVNFNYMQLSRSVCFMGQVKLLYIQGTSEMR